MNSATQRTLKYFRDDGYIVGKVECWNSWTNQRKDLFNIIDFIALKGDSLIGIQSCGQAFSEHKKKIEAEPLAREWLKTGSKLVLIGWRKLLKKRGGKLKVWVPRIYWFELDLLPHIVQ